jgi:glycopeptide antibiotics resistance protein
MRTVYELQGELGIRGFYFMLLGVVGVVLVGLRVLERRGDPALARTLAWIALLVALAGVLAATLRPVVPFGTADPVLYLDPIQGIAGWSGPAWRPVIDNVGLFIPLGAFAAAAMPRIPRGALWVGLVALSVGIEAFQYLVPSGRVANSADVLANGLGAAIGLFVHTLVAPRRRRVDAPLPGVDARR